jgi:hypothetical protein
MTGDALNSNSGTLKSAKENIVSPATKAVGKTGEIAKPMLEKLGEKLGLISQKKSFWQKPKFYIPAAILGLIAFFSRSNKYDY